MDVVVLAVPDCPSALALDERLASVLEDRPDVVVTRQIISDAGEAARWGMHGSPTILVNGSDPFVAAGQETSMSCRLYRDDDGKIGRVPSLAQLRQALSERTARPLARSGSPA
jgi:hypothetical protein